jgi:sialic acid synthase SpsE
MGRALVTAKRGREIMSKQVPFGKGTVGRGAPVYIVFEAGATHDGLETALKLVDMAAAAGADAVKFQVIDADRLIPDPNVMFTYEVLLDKASGERETVTESLRHIIRRRELTRQEWRRVVEHCRKLGIEFFSTAMSEDDLDFLAGMGVGSIKIASGDINYHHFMRLAAQKPWTVQIDTGSATLGEVERAVDVLETSGCENIIINHCPSGYPARLDGINLRVLTTLQQMFPYPVAFSDHTPGFAMDVAAVALGASMIEKTITLNRTIRSPEHIMSLEPADTVEFVRTIREVEQALGNTRRIMPAMERGKTAVARRSVVARVPISRGEIITQDKIDYVRPGDGLSPDLDLLVLGRCATHDITPGGKIFPEDVRR